MMNKFVSTVFILIIWVISFSKGIKQNDSLIIVGQSPISASFAGGNDSLYNYIKSNFKSPLVYDDKKSKENRIVVQILIDTNGIVKNPKILKDNVGWLKQEDVLDIFLKMPKWTPSIFNGKPIEQYFTIPIFIKLKE